MGWVKIDDNARGHRKMFRVGVAAFGWWVAALCYCSRHRTNGYIDPRDLDMIFYGMTHDDVLECVNRLTAEGLLIAHGANGYLVQGYPEIHLGGGLNRVG